MTDYGKLSKTELIRRLKALESKPREPAAKRGAAADGKLAQSVAALHDSEERLRAILQNAVEGIITIDEQGVIESMNQAAEKTFGFKAGEVVGRNVSILMPAPYAELHDGYMARYLATGQARIIGIGREVVGQRKDGTIFPIDLAVSEVRLANRRLFTGFVRDISERKKAESNLASLAQTLAEKNRELEAIVYAASHDLRSPLVNIQGFSKELAVACAQLRARLAAGVSAAAPGAGSLAEVQALLDADIPEALDYIQAGVAKIDALLAGFLRYSRLGRASLRLEPLDMTRMLEAIARSMEFQLKKAGVTLNLGQLPSCVGDETQINRVFTNLLDNAVKYLDPKRPGIISVSGRVQEGVTVYEVTDNGIGIAPEHQGKVFEIFHRLNPHAGEGEGLGLTIAQRILERQNGKIWVKSEPGKGSTFYISLPARPAPG